MAHLDMHSHDLRNLNEFGTTNQRLPTDFKTAHHCMWSVTVT